MTKLEIVRIMINNEGINVDTICNHKGQEIRTNHWLETDQDLDRVVKLLSDLIQDRLPELEFQRKKSNQQ